MHSSSRKSLFEFTRPIPEKDLAALGRAPEFTAEATGERREIRPTEADVLPEVVSFGRSRYRVHRPQLPEHMHSGCFEINLCQRGMPVYMLRGRRYEAKPGNVFVTKPGQPHQLTENIRGLSMSWLLLRLPEQGGALGLTETETAALRRSLETLPSPLFHVQEDVDRGFRELFRAYDASKRCGLRSALLKATVLGLLLAIVRDAKSRPHKIFSGKILEASEKLEDFPDRRHAISDLVAKSGMSSQRFSRLFKQATGLPPYKMMMMRRMNKARKFVVETDLPVADIAYSLGFSSPRHFADQFRATFGVSARALRADVNATATP
jgi:AraC-like DNA-binding protein